MLTQKIAEFVVDTKEVPAEVLLGATNALIDTLGVALVGATEPISAIARQWASALQAKPVATVWAADFGSSAGEAAFVNGLASHVLDYDDTSPSLRGHPSATLIPTVIAVGESLHSSGTEALTAYALGLDVAGKLAKALGNGHYTRGWHNSATVGVFSCTAAAGRLLGLNVEQLRTAFGLAASQSSGLVRNFGTMSKAFHVGHAARCAIHAAWLAQHGFTADTSILDGKDSFVATYGGDDGEPLAAMVAKLGSPWEILKPGIAFKRWPCCYQIHRGIVGLMDLIAQNDISTAEIEAIDIGFPPGSDAALIYDDPKDGLEGKFSTQYNVAAFVLDRKLDLTSYTEPMIKRPQVQALMRKVKYHLVPDTKSYAGTVGYTDVEIITVRGTFKRRVQQEETRAAWVVTDDEHDEKFMNCTTPIVGAQRGRALLALARKCTSLADVGELARAAAASNTAGTME